MKATTIMTTKKKRARICLLFVAISGVGMIFGSAEKLTTVPGGERPELRSKIHTPVKLAREVTPLPPPGNQLMFNDDFDGSKIDTKPWGFQLEGKMLTKEISSAGFPRDEMSVWFSVIASTLKGDRWVDESKLPNAVFCDYLRLDQHPEFREAEATVCAEVLRPRPPLPKKNDELSGQKVEDLH